MDGVVVCRAAGMTGPGEGRPAGALDRDGRVWLRLAACWAAETTSTHVAAVCALPPHPIPAGFATQKRACLQGQSKLRRRHTAAACKKAWAATHRDLTLQHAAVALLRQQPRRQLPLSKSTIVDDSADDTDKACCTALDSWEQRDWRQ